MSSSRKRAKIITTTEPDVICVDCGLVNACDCDTVLIDEERDWNLPCQKCREAVCECAVEAEEEQADEKEEQEEEEEDDREGYTAYYGQPPGKCCFCSDLCNPASQACGPCVRNGPMMENYFEMSASQ